MEKTERKCSLNAMKSVSRTMSMRERAAAPSEANKARGRLDKPRLLIHMCWFKGHGDARWAR